MEYKITKFRKKCINPYIAAIHELKEENINEILELHPIIRESLESIEDFYFDDYDFYKYHLDKGGKILGCYINCRLIAYGVGIFPGYDAENLGYDLNFNHDELPYVTHLDSFVVHPDYRGNNLQYALCVLMEEIAKKKGCRHLCSTVSPNNIYSLRNLITLGLEIKMKKVKYGGKLRYILYKSISQQL